MPIYGSIVVRARSIHLRGVPQVVFPRYAEIRIWSVQKVHSSAIKSSETWYSSPNRPILRRICSNRDLGSQVVHPVGRVHCRKAARSTTARSLAAKFVLQRLLLVFLCSKVSACLCLIVILPTFTFYQTLNQTMYFTFINNSHNNPRFYQRIWPDKTRAPARGAIGVTHSAFQAPCLKFLPILSSVFGRLTGGFDSEQAVSAGGCRSASPKLNLDRTRGAMP